MAEAPSRRDARSRLELQAIHALLEEQRRRIRAYVELQQSCAPVRAPAPPPVPSGPSGHEVLDALPQPAVLVLPLLSEDGSVRDAFYVRQNAAARAYGASRLPESALPLWSGPTALFEQFPALARTAVPAMLARAHRERAPQGPETIEWLVSTARCPVRLNDEVRVAPCGEHLLITWQPGHRQRMTEAAQRLVRTCWAEWNLGDLHVEPSRRFHEVLGLPGDTPAPTLSDLAAAVTPGTLPRLYQALYDVILRKRKTECEVRLEGAGERVFRMVAEPVRIAPGSLVWALRAVLIDVTAERRRRDSAEYAAREVHRQLERVEAVTEVADVLRQAVLPQFQDELGSYGLDAAAVYRPDAREARIGGDWYKARKLPDGQPLIALGDARGHGLEAATLMAKLRYALAGLAYTEQPVERLTQWLNEVACADGTESTATAIIARYQPGQARLRWTCAGHPRPVLLRDGRATQLPDPVDGPGLTLGVLPDTTYTAATTDLRVGDIVLMYSDGLTERRECDPDKDTRRFLAAAEECLTEAVPSAGHDALQDYAERLVARLDGPHRADDATLLAVRRIATG
ncbi:PP2C family protein-serine/threonine phosphatase [Streptomyces sp. NPDC006552]|uniref:PP2C family protein-serine/threonine phosphatase n=1 Tax=Streptomyces sp. NPDC006552 TaxID=3157179 RepID=UPI0033B84E8C